jgi:hypothetical protein
MSAPSQRTMIRVVTIIISCLMFVGNIIAQEALSRKHEKLRGPVRTVRVEKAWITLQDGRPVEGSRGLPQLQIFDLNGNKTEITYFQADGSPGVRLVYTFRPSQRLIERIDYDPDGAPKSKHTFIHDENGNIIESVYNSSNGNRLSKAVYSYDEKGHLLGEVLYGADGKPVRHDEFKYKLDEKGNVAERLNYHNSQYVGKTVSTYDAQGNVTERAHYATDGSLLQIMWSHSDWIRLSKESYTYKIDAHGNWTTQTMSLWDPKANAFIALEVVYRTIVYY